jgi:hypothetical protein
MTDAWTKTAKALGVLGKDGTLSILAGVVQSGAHPLPQNLAFACRKLTDFRHPCITNPRYFSHLTTGLISSMGTLAVGYADGWKGG